ncbi:MAG: ADP-ribosylglycohydrolase family protein [Chloroflexota bacterium]|jgi:ADP-ribosyl-[dinitrogen reductase] hydrolase
MNETIRDRIRGIIVGAAVGDALGMPLEFGSAAPVERMIRTMRSGRLPAGSFTDDTEMALALSESLLHNFRLDGDDLVQRFAAWYRSNPPDVGIHTANVLQRVSRGEPWQQVVKEVQLAHPHNAGNGSLMRCYPVAAACWNDLDALVEQSCLQSQVTHPHEDCQAACVFVNAMIFHLIHASPPRQAYQQALDQSQPGHGQTELPEGLRTAVLLAPRRKREELRNTGWVRHTLESAVWGLLTTDSFEDALVQVINLGADTDTTGAVTGALAGAAYGLKAIPPDWKNALRGEYPLKTGKIWRLDDFINLADQLAAKSAIA